jgi:acyl-CoA thioester hydrolase
MKVNTVRVRVRYPEVDRMNVVHHSNHPIWFEIGRTELMRDLGIPYSGLEAENLFMPVIELGVRYHGSVRYDEEVEIESFIEELKGARIRFGYRIVRPADRKTLAEGLPVRFPARLREILLSAAAAPGTEERS